MYQFWVSLADLGYRSVPGATTFQELKDGEQVPVGSTVDATDGRVRVVATDGFKAAGSGLFYGGVFVLRQREVRFAPAEMVLADRVHPGAVGIARASRRRRKKLTTRRLWGVARANFRTRGRFASATVRGTQWVTTDLPTGTRIHVRRGSVAVRDFAKHKSIVLQAGKSYFAKTWQKQVEAFESIREDLGNSYTVTYYPAANPNEGFRKISVELTNDAGKKYRIRARPGYRPRTY